MGCCSTKQSSKSNKKKSSNLSQSFQFHENSSRTLDKQKSLPTDHHTMPSLQGPFEILASLHNVPIATSTSEQREIEKILSSHPLFWSFSKEKLKELSKKFVSISYGVDTSLVAQNHNEENFYIIAHGTVDLILNNQIQVSLTKGMHFGEVSILRYSSSEVIFKTRTETFCYFLTAELFLKALQDVLVQSSLESFLKKVHFLNKIRSEKEQLFYTCLEIFDNKKEKELIRTLDKDYIYFVVEGKVIVSQDEENFEVFAEGECFSGFHLKNDFCLPVKIEFKEKAVLVRVKTSLLPGIDRNELNHLKFDRSVHVCLERSKRYSKLISEQKKKIIENVEIQYLEEGYQFENELITKQVFFIIQGEVLNDKISFKKHEQFKISRESKDRSLKTSQKTIIAKISTENLMKIFGKNLKSLLKGNQLFDSMKKVKIFKKLSYELFENLLSKSILEDFAYNELIYKQGEIGECLYLILAGQVKVTSSAGRSQHLLKFDYFGEGSFLHPNQMIDTAQSFGCQCLVIPKKYFELFINTETILKTLKHFEESKNPLNLRELSVIKLIGKGTFGNVFLTQSTKSKSFFALKSIHKQKVIQLNIFKNLIQEKKVLECSDHPFIVNLVKTFVDQQRVYFLMDLVNGIELFDLLKSSGKLRKDHVIFYSSCILLVLEYLHEQKIVYRDLKPENILIDDKGYPKLIDFGLSKILKGRTYSHAGTSYYMAPEVILGQGYGFEADYWSLGVMIYELLVGQVPWGGQESNPMEISRMILENDLIFPTSLKNSTSAQVIQKLLNKDFRSRANFKYLQKHLWFAGVDFDDLMCKTPQAPFLPSQKDDMKKMKSYSGKHFESFIKKFEEGLCLSSRETCEYQWDAFIN